MTSALLIIDMQMMMQDRIDTGRDHVNPQTAKHIEMLAAKFRAKGLPILHVRHRDDTAGSPLHPDAPSFQPMPCAVAREDEPIFEKTTSSAFASTDLAAWLLAEGIQDVMVTGAVASFCVNSTVRAGADLGFSMSVVEDAVIDFDLPNDGLAARTIFDVTLGLLKADFAQAVTTLTVIDRIAG